jgi:hypothetical protein
VFSLSRRPNAYWQPHKPPGVLSFARSLENLAPKISNLSKILGTASGCVVESATSVSDKVTFVVLHLRPLLCRSVEPIH